MHDLLHFPYFLTTLKSGITSFNILVIPENVIVLNFITVFPKIHFRPTLQVLACKSEEVELYLFCANDLVASM